MPFCVASARAAAFLKRTPESSPDPIAPAGLGLLPRPANEPGRREKVGAVSGLSPARDEGVDADNF
jgi:hypothetical protein